MLGAQAKLARVLHDLLPGTTPWLLDLVNRLIPVPTGRGPEQEARPAEPYRRGIARSLLTALGDRAARRYNERPSR